LKKIISNYDVGTKSPLTRVLAISGGKGGVGKTNLSINLSIALSKLGQRVMLLDADLGLANVDVLLGLKAKKTLEDVFSNNASLKDIFLNGPEGIKIIPSSSGSQFMANLSSAHHAGLIRAFSDISNEIDFLIVDTAAGVSSSVINFLSASQEILLVVCDEPASITDSYALMKILNRDCGISSFRLVGNKIQNDIQGKSIYKRLCTVANRFLDINITHEADIPYDKAMIDAIKKQQAVINISPGSPSSYAIKKLAKKIISWPHKVNSNGGIEFFIESLISPNQYLEK